jgi:hypothetical protein
MYTALDHHVTSCTYHQYALRRPAAPSLVHERPTRHSFRNTFLVSRQALARPTGQATPVPPSPQ